MRSLILTTATRYLLPLMLIFSVYLLIRGHNNPGGGFIGGLVAAASLALYGLAEGMPAAEQMMKVSPRWLISGGLLIALASAFLAPIFTNQPFMTSLLGKATLPAIGKLSTPAMFDLGVYLTVVGVTTLIIFSLAEDEEEGERD